ncbi:MAG TPA: hypothetical protein VEF33_04020 [Syntrophales bacterium]|nr:hypothetical protein [Syntrophales bacterium]
MKKTSIIVGLSICVIALVASLVYGDDFSFIGINWSDSPRIVAGKIAKSDYVSSASKSWLVSANLFQYPCGFPLYSIIKSRMVDESKYDFLVKISSDNMINFIKFFGKSDSIVKEANFWFPCKADTLLAYDITLNPSIVKVDEETGESQVYQSLVEKYGKPTKTTKRPRIWSKQDQTLYYWAVSGEASLIYVSEKNLSAFVAAIKGKEKELEESNKKKQADSVREDF